MPKNNEFANEVNNSNQVCTSAYDTGKENPFKGERVIGYIQHNVKMDLKYVYGVINAVGSCLDSDLSPVRIKDGDKLLVHAIPLTVDEVARNIGKIVCIMLKDGHIIVKQAVHYNAYRKVLIVRFLNPIEQRFIVHMSAIKALLVVDTVIDKEYFNKNMRPTTGK